LTQAISLVGITSIFFIIDLVIGPLSGLTLEMALEGAFGLVGVTSLLLLKNSTKPNTLAYV